MPTVWAVIGQHNARKSSTIRALTGKGNVRLANPGLWDVLYVGLGLVPTLVFPVGLQEVNIPAAQFILTVGAIQAANVIVAMRYDSPLGNAQAYLTAFQAAGWNIAGYAVLGPHAPLPGFAGGVPFPNAAVTPSNQIAAQLRTAWGII
jgi:hypothetical protein